jgi:PAS domain S-box-containing protein
MTEQLTESSTTLASLRLIYEISRELATAFDLRTVLTRVLFLSLRNVQGSSGAIIVLDDAGQPLDSAIIHAGNVQDANTQRLRATLDSGLAGWVLRNRQSALVTDTAADERWIKRDYAGKKDAGPGSSVSAPLMVRDRLVGVITLTHPRKQFFNAEHEALIQAIADQAAIAVLNARLVEESQRKAAVSSALAQSAASINATLDLEEVLQRILEQISEVFSAEAVSLLLIEPETQDLVFRAATGSKRDKILGQRIRIGQGVVGWVAQQGEGVVLQDVSKDHRFYAEMDQSTGYKTRALAAAPIRAKGRIIGVLEALNPAAPFENDALQVLEGIGNLAGTAIDHAQLFNQVEAARTRYLELFEDNIDPIFITDEDGKILEANRQAEDFIGFAAPALHKMNIYQFHKVDWQALGQDFAALRADQGVMYESLLHPGKGEELDIEVHVRRVTIDGAPRLQWQMRDISERRTLDKLRDDLMSMIYHDLRSPLSNVISSLELIAAMLPEGEANLANLVEIAVRSTERVQRLASSLLDTARLEAGQRIGNQQPASLRGLMAEAAEAVELSARSKDMPFETAYPDPDLTVRVDADMIRRVMINLLENAVKYSPEGTQLTLGAMAADGMAQVWVADTGRGIPAEDQERIFEKYSRARIGAGAAKGLGLGLAFCKLAVEGHGGQIWVQSELDKGSTFTFTLPLARE